jgi:hypothetical protein
MSSMTLYYVALFQTNVSENISSPSSGVLRLIGFQLYYTVVMYTTVISLYGKAE